MADYPEYEWDDDLASWYIIEMELLAEPLNAEEL
jgi:hypothetical protein